MRPVTESLIRSILLDLPPSPAALVDFGLDGPDVTAKYGALQYGFRAEAFDSCELDAALGNGPALTALVARFGCTLIFATAWDAMGECDDDDDEWES